VRVRINDAAKDAITLALVKGWVGRVIQLLLLNGTFNVVLEVVAVAEATQESY
jgi:hypothetical protein